MAFYPRCGGFCNRGSLLSEVPLYMHTHLLSSTSQAALKAAKQELDQLKSALRERNKELQKFEQERRSHEKKKVDASLKIKELEHKIAKFHKDSKDAAQKVWVARHGWIKDCP